MLSKVKQKFLKVASFVVLILFQIWAIPNRPPDILLTGALAALAGCAMIITLAYRWDEPDYLDWSVVGYFSFISAFLFSWPEPAKLFLHHYAGIAIFGSFFAAAFFPPLFGFAPFTVHSAKKKAPKVLWNHPAFMEINKIITYVWAGIFAICMMLSYSPSIMLKFVLPNILMLGFGLPFSSRFAAYYLRKKEISFRPSSIEEFMSIMPLGFNPRGAKGVDAVIQFDFAGDREGSCHFKIANCKIETGSGATDNPALTIAAPFDIWMDVMAGQANAQQMFVERKFQASGDMSLLLKMGELFNKNRKERAAR